MRVLSLMVLIAVFPGAAMLAGCTGAKAPSFRVVEAELTSESADGYVVTFVVEGENENAFPVPLREVDYRLMLAGETVFAGRRSAEVTLPAGSTERVVLPVSVPFGEGAGVPAIVEYRLSGRVTYVLPGAIAELLFDNQIRQPKVSFTERGELVGG